MQAASPGSLFAVGWCLVRWLLLAWLVGCGLGPALALDRWPAGLALTAPPRALLIGLAVLLALGALLEARRQGGTSRGDHAARRAVLAGSLALALVPQLGWGGAARPVPADALTVLSYNVHHAAEGAPALVRLAEELEVDLLCLQEVGPRERPAFAAALAGWTLVAPDETARFEHDDHGPFSNLIAARPGLVVGGAPRVETAITGYRTLAARLELAQGPLWVVDVHASKPFWSPVRHPRLTLSRAAEKALWHLDERDRLAAWLDGHRGEAVLLAGDFNAALGGRGLDLPGTVHAHRAVGAGWHRTAPAVLPLWGIDHVLGSGPLRFHELRRVDPGLSDHVALLARFSLVPRDDGQPGAGG